jgi:copper resistance protein C
MSTLHRFTSVTLATLMSLGLLCVLVVGTASAHAAHAKVTSATPAISSTIAQAPTSVTVVALENIKPGPQFSNLFVYGPSGDLISQGDAKVSLNNPQQMSVAIKSDGNGVYVVRWVTVSALDGDPDQGAFVFTVNPNALVTPTATPAKQVTTPPTNTAGTAGTPIWVSVVTSVVALLVGLGAGVGIGRRRTAVTATASTDIPVAEKEKAAPKRP